jgi:hypothetical protein
LLVLFVGFAAPPDPFADESDLLVPARGLLALDREEREPVELLLTGGRLPVFFSGVFSI